MLNPRISRAMTIPRSDIRYVVSDRRHPESIAFAALLVEDGCIQLDVGDGLTRLWQTALQPLWRGQGGMVAGLTRDPAWLCLVEQARGCGRRPILTVRHASNSCEGGGAHAVTGPRASLDYAPALANCGKAWPNVMAHIAARCAPRPGEVMEQIRQPAATGTLPDTSLVSWIIA
jgi:hypothetical protein